MKKVIFIIFAVILFSGCSKKDLAVGEIVSKKIDGDKLNLVVLSVNEHDERGNIIHKRVGIYNPETKGKEKVTYFLPRCRPSYDVWYDNEYDESGNLTHTFIHNSKDQETWDYSFKYGDNGKIVYANTKRHPADYIPDAFDEYECFYDYDEKGSISHYKESKEKEYARLLPESARYFEWDYQHEYEGDYVYTENTALLTYHYWLCRVYDQVGRIDCVYLREGSLSWHLFDREPTIHYYYGKKVNTEYYYNYKKKAYGYDEYFGSKNLPLGIDGKLNFNTLNWDYKNRDTKTVVEYYLREDGTVEKSIEYTGKRRFKHYKTVKFRGKVRGGSRKNAIFYVPTLIPFFEYE